MRLKLLSLPKKKDLRGWFNPLFFRLTLRLLNGLSKIKINKNKNLAIPICMVEVLQIVLARSPLTIASLAPKILFVPHLINPHLGKTSNTFVRYVTRMDIRKFIRLIHASTIMILLPRLHSMLT